MLYKPDYKLRRVVRRIVNWMGMNNWVPNHFG